MIWRASIRTIRLNSNKIFSDPWTILNVKRDATREEVKNAFIHLARIYHPDNNPSTKSADTFHAIQNAYLEAIKHASPGVDRTIKDDWSPRVKNRYYNPDRGTPEYSKVIEAENIKSTIDTEAEFNRDPALIRWRIFIVMSLAVMAAFGFLMSRTADMSEAFNESKQTYIKANISQRERILDEKTEHETSKKPFS